MDNEEKQKLERVQIEISMHTITPVPNNYCTKIPTCIVFSVEEGVMRRVKAFENEKEGIALG